jgi:hypothetical protein
MVAIEEYFSQQSITVLENLFKMLNSIDMSVVPRANALHKSLLMRDIALRKNSEVLDDWIFKTNVEIGGKSLNIHIPYYRSLDEISSANITRLVNVLGPNVMRLYHSILTGQRVLFIGYNHSAADIADIVLSAGKFQ